MSLVKLVRNLIQAVDKNIMTKENAFDQLSEFYKKSNFNIPRIPKDDEEKKKLTEFIEMAERIVADYTVPKEESE